jgi:TonB family protein
MGGLEPLEVLVLATVEVSARGQKAPVLRDSPCPIYPVEMEGTGLDSRAELLFIVRTDGSVQDTPVRSATHPMFGYGALDVIESWRFKPGMRDGRIVPMRVAQPSSSMPGPFTRRKRSWDGSFSMRSMRWYTVQPRSVDCLRL